MTRTTGRLSQKSVINKELQEIQNSTEARSYLEKTLLIVPPGQEPTLGLLSTAIHQVTEYKGVPTQAINALRSIAFLLNELEENTLHEAVRDSVTVQLNDMGSDLRELVTDATRRIDEHLKNKLSEISDATKTLMDSVKESLSDIPPPAGNTSNIGNAPPLNYRQALVNPPPHVNPRLAAKEGIKLRQFLVEGVTRDSRIGKMNTAEAKKTVNEAIGKAGGDGLKARSALRQYKSGLLVEMETDAGAAWLTNHANARSLCDTLGPNLNVKQRMYNVFVYNASTALDPENADHLKEISETNGIQDGGLTAMRWVKPTNRRNRADQRTAHLILTFSNADDANRAILSGLTVCQRCVRVAKPKKEPIRCMKCHNWNHVAWECIAKGDICGTCGDTDHWTKDCTNKEKKYCVSCESVDHASWSWTCPVFLRKCEELDKRTPENNLPFFPASEPWTWSSTPPLASHPHRAEPPPPIHPRGRNQRDRIQLNKDIAPNGRPYERSSWNRPGITDKPSSPPHPPSPIPPPLPSFFDVPEQIDMNANTEQQVPSSQDSMYA
jgi:hypothetical protein